MSLKRIFIITLAVTAASAVLVVPRSMAADNSLAPSLSVREQYSSNAGYDAAGNEQDDFITTISPVITFNRLTRRSSMDASYGLNSYHHSRYNNLDRLSHNGSVKLSLQPSERTSFSASDHAQYEPDSLGTDTTGVVTGRAEQITPDSLGTSATGIRTQRADKFSNNLTLALSRVLSQQSILGLTFSDSIIEYSGSSLIDTRTDSATAQLSHSLSARTQLDTDYTYTLFTFGSGAGTEIDTHALSLGVTETFSPVLTASVKAGANYTPELVDSFDWNAGATVHRSFKSSTLDLGYARRITSTSGLSDRINVNESFTAAYSHNITGKLSAALTSVYSVNSTSPSAGLDSSSVAAGVTGTWKPGVWMAADLGYNYFTQWTDSATIPGLSSESYFANVSFTPVEWKPFSAAVGFNHFEQRSDSATATDITNNTVFISVTLAPDAWRL